jgi:hypothetical protein
MKNRTACMLMLLLSGCVGRRRPEKPPASDAPCLIDILEVERGSASCHEAQGKVEVLLRYSPSCREVFGDGGFDVCAKLRHHDGGTHD